MMDPFGERLTPQDQVPAEPSYSGKGNGSRVNVKPKFSMKQLIPPGSSTKPKVGKGAVRARESSDEDIASGSESTGDSYADYDMDSASSDDTETEIAKAQAGPSKSKQT